MDWGTQFDGITLEKVDNWLHSNGLGRNGAGRDAKETRRGSVSSSGTGSVPRSRKVGAHVRGTRNTCFAPSPLSLAANSLLEESAITTSNPDQTAPPSATFDFTSTTKLQNSDGLTQNSCQETDDPSSLLTTSNAPHNANATGTRRDVAAPTPTIARGPNGNQKWTLKWRTDTFDYYTLHPNSDADAAAEDSQIPTIQGLGEYFVPQVDDGTKTPIDNGEEGHEYRWTPAHTFADGRVYHTYKPYCPNHAVHEEDRAGSVTELNLNHSDAASLSCSGQTSNAEKHTRNVDDLDISLVNFDSLYALDPIASNAATVAESDFGGYEDTFTEHDFATLPDHFAQTSQGYPLPGSANGFEYGQPSSATYTSPALSATASPADSVFSKLSGATKSTPFTTPRASPLVPFETGLDVDYRAPKRARSSSDARAHQQAIVAPTGKAATGGRKQQVTQPHPNVGVKAVLSAKYKAHAGTFHPQSSGSGPAIASTSSSTVITRSPIARTSSTFVGPAAAPSVAQTSAATLTTVPVTFKGPAIFMPARVNDKTPETAYHSRNLPELNFGKAFTQEQYERGRAKEEAKAKEKRKRGKN